MKDIYHSYLIFFNLNLYNCFTILCWFLPYIQHESAIDIHMSPSSWTSISPPIPIPPPLRCHRAPDLKPLTHTANFYWISVRRVSVTSPVLFRCSKKFEVKDRPLLQLYVTAQFYLASKGKYILKARGQANTKDSKKIEDCDLILAPLFMYFSLLPPELALCKLGWPGRLFFYLTCSLQSSDLPLFYFLGRLPFFVF